MSLMRQLEEIIESDELEDWEDQAPKQAKWQGAQKDNWFNEMATSNRPQNHYLTEGIGERHYNGESQYSKPATNFHGIQSVDYSSQDEETEHRKSSMSFDNTSDTSNIHHFNTSTNDSRLSTSVLSDKARSIFDFHYFNKMQSNSFKPIYEEDNNCVISSPTGSGKTVLFELAIVRLLNLTNDPNTLKVLYISPTKALCLEREKDWCSKFSSYGLTVGALTSDTSYLETDKVKKANIIITTPEKWDLVTRKWADYSKLFKLIKLLLVDEIHILRDNRGSTLEVVITRMKKICRPLRIIALSATVPNIQDVSGWIKLNSDSGQNAVTLVFGDEYRPVKLEKLVFGYRQTMNDFVFDSFLNNKLVEIIREHSNNKPVLIFCPTRNSTISTAKYLSKNLRVDNRSQSPATIKEKELKELSMLGFSYHHAGLSLPDRLSVEKNFINGNTKVLCSTSTLAVGVNLPAYLVVIKGTKTWTGAAFEEYSELDILQMMGRAGRPQFETQGKAVLMTDSDKHHQYEKLVKGTEKLESRLHLNLSENMVPEVFLKTVNSVEGALEWLKLTFFYTRFKNNPTAYDEIPYLANGGMDARLLRFVESKLRELTDFKLIEIKNGEYQCTQFGNAMTKHYILFDTMKMFVKCPRGLTVSDIINLVSKSSEFENIRLKRTEKKLFRELNNSPILKYPIKTNNKLSNITSNDEKINLLIQYELGGLEYPNGQEFLRIQQSFKQDKFFVFKHIGRLIRCLVDCFLEKADYVSLLNCLKLSRCLNGKCWEDTSIVLRQLEGVGIAAVRRFSNQNIKSFGEVKNLSSSTIEYYLNQRPGFGAKVLKAIAGLPSLSIETHLESSTVKKGELKAVIRMNINCQMETKSWHGKPVTVNIISGLSTGDLVDFRRAHLNKLSGAKSFTFECSVLYKDTRLISSVSCEEIAGISQSFEINLQEVLPHNQVSGLRIFSTVNEKDNLEGLDDDEIDDLLVEATNNKKSAVIKSNIAKEFEDETTSATSLTCKHACKDKATCRHLCCREGLAPKPVKRIRNRTAADAENVSVKKTCKADDKPVSKHFMNKSSKGHGLFNKPHKQASPNKSPAEPNRLNKYKYYEPELGVKEKGEEPRNNSKSDNTVSSEVDVVGLLREVHRKSKASITMNIDEDETSDSSVMMIDAPVESELKDAKPDPEEPVYPNDEGLWSDDMYHEGNNIDANDDHVKNDHMKKSDMTPEPEHENSSHTNTQNAELELKNNDENDADNDDSFGDLGDLLGSDVEFI